MSALRAQRAQEFEQEHPRLAPFPQWGGSGNYARRLVDLLPKHSLYVEPFCGAASMFFAKRPAPREVLADTDPDVIFTLQYIQDFDGRKMQALKRFTWKVSPRGLRKAHNTVPKSDSERVWRHIYCRVCTWGSKPTCQGYSSIHDGDVYDLESLWRFKERLHNTIILQQHWKITLRRFGPASSGLFFIDPPYIKEWSIAPGIPPEDIAKAVRKVSGHYLIAYTDSARARRAFARSGIEFKLRFKVTRRYGVFAKRSRLFVKSWQ